jgi:catechol 2,3-dioxygenase-like lactoylglutathione lyase family enzyme
MLTQIDHVNLVVADLEAMIGFYTMVLGLRLTKRATISGEWIAAVVGLTDVNADVAYLDLPAGPRIELIRYNHPAAARPPAIDRANTPGIRHLAFKVDDLDATATKLAAAGVKLFSPVQSVPDGQVTYAGGVRKRLVYFPDPEGNLLEMCEYKS